MIQKQGYSTIQDSNTNKIKTTIHDNKKELRYNMDTQCTRGEKNVTTKRHYKELSRW